jgi:hypothetical protein
MLTAFITLIFITVIVISVPLYMTVAGFPIPNWILDMVGGFIGSIVAIIGSVSFQLLTERRKEHNIFEKNLLLLKEELYNNFIVCIQRVISVSDSIDFFQDAYKNFIISYDVNNVNNQSNIGSEVAKLYFIVTRGHQTLKPVKAFLNEVLIIQKKHPRNFSEVQDIVQSTGIDYIFEFAVIRYMILLNENQKMKMPLPFYDMQRFIQHEKGAPNIEDEILIYITELVCKSIFKNDRILYYQNFLRERELQNASF